MVCLTRTKFFLSVSAAYWFSLAGLHHGLVVDTDVQMESQAASLNQILRQVSVQGSTDELIRTFFIFYFQYMAP